MLSLVQLQQQTARALLTGETDAIAGAYTAGTANARRRLGIYRNNTLISLGSALRAMFPVTVKLADERFFDFAAHSFIASSPPREARLSAYGGNFPAFLRHFEPCRAYPIIAEMAAFELAVHSCLMAAQERPIPFAALQSTHGMEGTASFLLQPNLRFAASRWNLMSVWVDHKTGRAPRLLEKKSSRFAICRDGDDIQFLPLEPARFAFWRNLAKRQPLDQAMERAIARDPFFDPVTESLLLFRTGLVTGLVSTPSPTSAKD